MQHWFLWHYGSRAPAFSSTTRTMWSHLQVVADAMMDAAHSGFRVPTKATLCKQIQSINQINIYRAIVQRRVLQWGYAESKRNVLRQILNVLTDGAVRQFSEREFQSLGAAIEK